MQYIYINYHSSQIVNGYVTKDSSNVSNSIT